MALRTTLLAALCAALPASAGERAFAFTWDSSVLEAGKTDVEAWLTPRFGRPTNYVGVDGRVGVGQGLTSAVETQLFLDWTTIETGVDDRDIHAQLSSLWHWRLLGPEAPVSAALVGRLSLGPQALDLELRGVLDRRFGPVLLALNASLARTASFVVDPSVNTRVEQDLAVRYLVGDGLAVGLETRAREGWATAGFQGTAFYAGPTFTWATGRLYFALGFQAQVAAYKAKADRGNGDPATLRDDERFAGRFVVGLKTE
jgi:hypothetical protein